MALGRTIKVNPEYFKQSMSVRFHFSVFGGRLFPTLQSGWKFLDVLPSHSMLRIICSIFFRTNI
jgi:hypothetical protein